MPATILTSLMQHWLGLAALNGTFGFRERKGASCAGTCRASLQMRISPGLQENGGLERRGPRTTRSLRPPQGASGTLETLPQRPCRRASPAGASPGSAAKEAGRSRSGACPSVRRARCRRACFTEHRRHSRSRPDNRASRWRHIHSTAARSRTHRPQMLDDICVRRLGGLAAEEVVLGERSACGAADQVPISMTQHCRKRVSRDRTAPAKASGLSPPTRKNWPPRYELTVSRKPCKPALRGSD